MKKYIFKIKQKIKDYYKKPRSGFSATRRNLATLQDKSVNRFWQNAARLEHTNVRNKNKGKKR